MTQTAPLDQLRAFAATSPFSSPQIHHFLQKSTPIFSAAKSQSKQGDPCVRFSNERLFEANFLDCLYPKKNFGKVMDGKHLVAKCVKGSREEFMYL